MEVSESMRRFKLGKFFFLICVIYSLFLWLIEFGYFVYAIVQLNYFVYVLRFLVLSWVVIIDDFHF